MYHHLSHNMYSYTICTCYILSTEQTTNNYFNFNKTGLSPNTSYSLSVLASNGVLNSSEASTITIIQFGLSHLN